MIVAIPPATGVGATDAAALAQVAAVDWNGRLRAKPIPASGLDQAFARGVAITSAIFAVDHAERPILTGRFQDPANGYRDAHLVPDADARYRDPLASDNVPLLLGHLIEDHACFCPRAILRREVDALSALGFEARGAFEFEYHLLQETEASLAEKTPASLQRLPALRRMYSWPDQALLGDFFDAARRAAVRAGVPVASWHAEFTGLVEAALEPAPGMAMADQAVLFKALAKVSARQCGYLATFMPRLADGFETAGGHLNLSLVDGGGAPAFFAAGNVQRLTPAARHFIGGLQRYGPELTLLFLSNLNSYKRFQGVSFAPRVNAWGIDNKTCAWRVVNRSPDLARIECRLPGADVHPHLALAAVLAAGRRGLAECTEPLPAVEGDAAASPHVGRPFCGRFEEAIAAWRGSGFACEVFGADFVEAFAESRDWQISQLAASVTDWELRQFAEGA